MEEKQTPFSCISVSERFPFVHKGDIAAEIYDVGKLGNDRVHAEPVFLIGVNAAAERLHGGACSCPAEGFDHKGERLQNV